MQKKFIQSAGRTIAAAMAVTILVVFILQTFSAYRTAKGELDYLLSDVQARLEENDAQIAQLKDSLNADYLARTRAFAYMIEQNPEILDSQQELSRITERLDVDELHVTDAQGIIRWGTVPDYIGFDMAGADQTAEFLPLLKDRSMELAQEPQPNGTKGILFQYVGVSRYDKAGIVQIGMQPTRLEAALKNNEIGNVLERYHEEHEWVFALNASDGTVAWHPDGSLIGKKAEEIGLGKDPASLAGKYQTRKVAGKRCYLAVEPAGDYLVAAQISKASMMEGRNMQLVVLIISDILVVLVLVAAIRGILRRQIADPIQEIAAQLKEIERGNLETEVDVRTCPEFERLSDGINAMAASIHEKISQTEELLGRQRQVSGQVMESAATLNRLSDGNMATAQRLAEGAGAQTDAMKELNDHIGVLAEQMLKDCERAATAKDASHEAQDLLLKSVEELNRLAEAMRHLNERSDEIQQVVKASDSVSFQTNILALNAAVEAARAGEAGKGFAVVADEVRNLAGKSAESAKQAAEMLGETIRIMKTGEELSLKASQIVNSAMEKAKQVNSLAEEIEHSAERQTETILQVCTSGEQVSSVIEDNSRLAVDGQEGVTGLLGEIKRLQELAGNQADG